MDNREQVQVMLPPASSQYLAAPLVEGQRWAWFGALADGRDLDELSRLPAALRVAPAWLLDEPAEQARVQCAAIGAITLAGPDWDDERVIRWLTACPFDNVTHLELRTPTLGGTGLDALIQRWPGLESISLFHGWERLEPDKLAFAGPSAWYLHRPPRLELERWIKALGNSPIESLRIGAAELFDASAPTQAWPRLRQLAFEQCELDGDVLARWLAAAGQGLDRLTLVGKLPARTLEALATRELAPQHLRVFGSLFDDRLVERMIEAGSLDRLVTLALIGCDVSGAGLNKLATRLGAVRGLDLTGLRMDDHQLASLLAATPRLQHLCVARTGVTGDGLAAALKQAGIARLVELDASGVAGAARALAAVAGPELPELLYLGLRDGAADAEGLAALLDRALPRFRLLDLTGSVIGALPLDRPLRLPALQHLEAQFTRLALPSPEHLFAPDSLPALRALRIADNQLSVEAGEALARLLTAIPIRSLDLNGSFLWEAETYARVAAAGAQSLVHLSAGYHGGTQPGLVDALIQAPWPALTVLDLAETKLPVEQHTRLLDADCPRLTDLTVSFNSLEELEVLAGNDLLRRLRQLRAISSDDHDLTFLQELLAAGNKLPPELDVSFM